MKRIFILLFLAFILTSAGFGQNFKFANLDQPEIISVPTTGEDSSKEWVIYLNVVNTSTQPIKLMAYRTSVDYAPGHKSYFCWDLCYPDFTDSSDAALSIQPGDTTGFQQYLTFKTGGVAGYSEVTMTIQDSISKEEISYTFLVSVGGVMAVEDKLLAKEAMSNPFPNPARNEAFVKIEMPLGIQQGSLRIFNLIGKKVLDVPVASRIGTVRLPLENLRSGMYFLYLVGDGEEISSRKLIITK
ncbi:MAG: T9SS type A sorting domain-containing protein [Bacteroidota bacterium]